MPLEPPLDSVQVAQIATLLGRAPRGLEAIAVRNATGDPAVIRVASLVDDKPFPTLFWLVDSELNYRLDQLEASGLIRQLQQQVHADETLRASLAEDHRRYIALREQYMSPSIKQRLEALGYYQALQRRGIGGIADFSCIRCLHTHYAAHLFESNTLGRWLDSEFLISN